MSKKINEKKKVNVKLSANQSYLVADIDVFMHMQKTYADLLRSVKVESDRQMYISILNKLNEAFENAFISSEDGSGDDW